jgi:hypothetical protein
MNIMRRIGLGLAALVLMVGGAAAQLASPPLIIHELSLSGGTKTATAVAGAVTLAKSSGVITSEALTTAAGATYTLTITNSLIAATDQVYASVALGTSTTGMPTVATVKPGAGSVVIVFQNIHASAALNGTLRISYMLLKQ